LIIFFKFLIFFAGACLGSFLNVVIYRIPIGMSVVTPRSKCPGCKKPIYWFENIPMISYLFLKGKCSECDFKISMRYPLIELLCGVVTLILFLQIDSYSQIYFFLFQVSISMAFIALFFIDLDHKLLPDSINLYLGSILLAYSAFQYSWKYMLLGFLIGGGFPLLITWLFYKLRGKIGLGGGDIKLWAALGIYLGPVDVVHNIFLSCLLGAIVGLSMIAGKVINKENAIPFGPFILIIATLQIFLPDLYAQLKSLIV